RLNVVAAFVQTPSSPATQPRLAVSQDAWVFFNQLPGTAPAGVMEIIGHGGFGNDFDLQAEGDNRFHFYIGGGNQVASTTIIQTGVWYHVVGTWDSASGQPTSGLKMYVNGMLENTNPALVTR